MLNRLGRYLEQENQDYWGLREDMARTGVELAIDFSEARALLALIPTTFRWGTAPDCGFSLKAKLSQYIEGVYRDPRRDQNEAQAQSSTQGIPGDKPAA